MTATPAQLAVLRLACEAIAPTPGYASLEYIQEIRAHLRTALIAMDIEAELAEQGMEKLRRQMDQVVRGSVLTALESQDGKP